MKIKNSHMSQLLKQHGPTKKPKSPKIPKNPVALNAPDKVRPSNRASIRSMMGFGVRSTAASALRTSNVDPKRINIKV